MTTEISFGVFGEPHPDCATVPAGAVQLSPLVPGASPLVPGASALEDQATASLGGMVMAAPPGTVERRHAMALSLRALQPGAAFTVMAPKEKGGGRIAQELEAFGCAVETSSRRHQRICHVQRPQILNGIEDAIADGEPRLVTGLNLWSQPGVFSWDRIDPGTALLLSVLPSFGGRGADLGCGIGVIAQAVLGSAKVTHLHLIDIDRRAVAAARRNITDPRAAFRWADTRRMPLKDLDFVVMNPPFHDGGLEDKALGLAFIQQALRYLRAGGAVWLVANRHLPYEDTLATAFASFALQGERDGYKIYEARK